MKQSLKTKIPVIDSIINIEDFLKSCNADNRFICYLNKDKSHMFDKKIHKDRWKFIKLKKVKELICH